jgi:hypothetical protein
MEIFSFIVSIVIVAWFIWTRFLSRISINWARTFWTKRIIGIEIWFWDKEHFGAAGREFKWGKMSPDEYSEYHSKQ